MVRIDFMGPIESESLELEVANLFDLRDRLQQIPEVANWLDISAIALNDDICRDIHTPLKNGDRIVILPPVCGG